MKRARFRPLLFRILCFIILPCLVGGSISSKIVTLESIQIFTTHEWFSVKPKVYFHCHGEKNHTVLPDVKEVDVIYAFNGEESWQPLTELPERKCKRCGLYEEERFKSDDVFDEWELCPGDFVGGKYVHFKEKEFNATFACPRCRPPEESPHNSTAKTEAKSHGVNITLVIVISTLVSVVVIIGAAIGFKYWQKKKREQEQARFLKLFEDGDDIEDELGLEDTL